MLFELKIIDFIFKNQGIIYIDYYFNFSIYRKIKTTNTI